MQPARKNSCIHIRDKDAINSRSAYTVYSGDIPADHTQAHLEQFRLPLQSLMSADK